MAKKGKPTLPDMQTLETMGFVRTGDDQYHAAIKKALRIEDEQIHCNRFKWYGLPRGIEGNLIERMLYYRGQVAWFYLKPQKKFVVLPFVLNGDIDLYGRYTSISPLPFNGSTDKITNMKKARESDDMAVRAFTSITANCIYDPVDLDQIVKDVQMDEQGNVIGYTIDEAFIENSAVILTDYSKQISQYVVPKWQLTDAIIDMEARLLPYVNTALSNATGVAGMKISSQDEQANVELASAQVQYAALTGRKWVPIDGAIDFQELTGGQVAKAEEFLLTMQSMKNFRLGLHGVSNNGIFEKAAHTTDLENSVNLGNSNFVLDDALYQRQQWCKVVNSLTGFAIWCEPAEVAIGMDTDMNGSIQADGSDQMVDGSNIPDNGGPENGD